MAPQIPWVLPSPIYLTKQHIIIFFAALNLHWLKISASSFATSPSSFHPTHSASSHPSFQHLPYFTQKYRCQRCGKHLVYTYTPSPLQNSLPAQSLISNQTWHSIHTIKRLPIKFLPQTQISPYHATHLPSNTPRVKQTLHQGHMPPQASSLIITAGQMVDTFNPTMS